MARRRQYLKFAAFIPAIVLVGGFVGCRSGMFERFSKPEPLPEPHPLGFNEAKPPATPQAPPPAPESKRPVYMSGTKSPNLSGITLDLTPIGEQNTPPAPPQAAGSAPPNAPGP